MQMKRMPILLATTWLSAGGCADPLEQRSTQEVQEQLERGVTGHLVRWNDLLTIRRQSIAARKLIRSA